MHKALSAFRGTFDFRFSSKSMETVTLVECPRDAWQGLHKYMPAKTKAGYLRRLFGAGFRHLDAVSFVSPKHVPQMSDSEEVMRRLVKFRPCTADAGRKKSKIHNSKVEAPRGHPNFEFRVSSFDSPASADTPEIIGIVVNEKGLRRALATPGVTTIGYPHSLSARFLHDNARMTVEESRALVELIKLRADEAGRGFVVYLSMAFGNPYGEPWAPEQVSDTVAWLQRAGIRTISLADTVGRAQAADVSNLFRFVRQRIDENNGTEIGVHLHSRPDDAAEKVLAAFEAGCRRFDSALTGLGGCPFAGDALVGNIPTEIVAATLAARGTSVGIEPGALRSALEAAQQIRRDYA